MSRFQRPIRHRTNRPPGNASINWGNPISRGLVSAILGKQDVAYGKPPTTITAIYAHGSQGLTLNADGTYAQFTHRRAEFTNKCTYFAFYDNVSTAGGPNSFVFGDVEAGGFGYNAGLYDNGSQFLFYVKNTGGSGVSAVGTTASNVIASGIRHCGTYDGAEIAIWINGRREGTSAQSGNIGTDAFSLNVNRWNGASPHHTYLHVAYVFNRCLTPHEIKALSANPWLLFAHKGLVINYDAPLSRTAFQPNAFQLNAFQVWGGTAGTITFDGALMAAMSWPWPIITISKPQVVAAGQTPPDNVPS